MPELRHPRSLSGTVSDYRRLTAGTGDETTGHHQGDARQSSRVPVLRERRNGLSVVRPYEWGRSSYPWAVRVLKAAEAVYGAPETDRTDWPTRAQKPRCDGCGYIVARCECAALKAVTR